MWAQRIIMGLKPGGDLDLADLMSTCRPRSSRVPPWCGRRELVALRGMFSTWDLFEPLAEPGTEQAPPVSDDVTYPVRLGCARHLMPAPGPSQAGDAPSLAHGVVN